MDGSVKMKQEDLLINRLLRYGRSDMYPFHMPGHKRAAGLGFGDPFAVDITEIHGFDNLHHPEGILKESMEWAAGLYGADRTFYLVNGSTAGILSAVCGSVLQGGRILVSRNCHKSVYHGIYMNRLNAVYVYPQEVPGLGIQGGISPDDVDRLLKKYMDIQAVLIVSPTYDGVVSDIKRIAGVVHGAGLPLIVDEAHGAHFRYGEMFPASALELGADVVIQSVHKTMPSLTQTALLHIKNNKPDHGCYADEDRISRQLQMVQSSSPSYVLLASIESSIFYMENMDFGEYWEGISRLRERLSGLKRLHLVDKDLIGKYGIFDLDLSKIVLSARGAFQVEMGSGQRGTGTRLTGGGLTGAVFTGTGFAGTGLTGAGFTGAELTEAGLTGTELTGAMLDDMLRQEYHLEMEMCGADYVTAITTVMDRHQGLVRLGDALLEIDGRLEAGSGDSRMPCLDSVYSMRSETAMTIAEAMDGELCQVKLTESAGYISGEFIYIYPPGIPLLVPGEWISRQTLDIIQEYMAQKLPVQGPLDRSLTYIRAVKKRTDVYGT